jgi:nucleotide-binding universal stress UspA family protein
MTDLIPSTLEAAPPMTIVVTTDGSDHSARALGPARRLAASAGASVVELGPGESQPDVEGGGQASEATVCLATRRYGRSGVLRRAAEHGAATLCVGPRVEEPPWHPRLGVLVCLDGSAESERAIGPARRWAGLLGEAITLLTVTAASEPGTDGPEHRFHFGPPDPGRYLGALADDLRAAGEAVSTVVLNDELSPASALRQHLREDRSSLVVTSTSSRTNLRAILLRSVAAMIVDNSTVPVLLLPPPPAAVDA